MVLASPLRMALVAYFCLAFVISWGGIVLVVGLDGFPATPTESDALFPAVYLAMLAGPASAGIVMTALVHGRAGLRASWGRLMAWRVHARWYAAALLIAPVTVTTAVLILSVISPSFIPGIVTNSNRLPLVAFGLVIGAGAGFFEELGWTGFAIPEMLKKRSVGTVGVIVGFLWGAWHFLAVYWGAADAAGSLPRALVIPIDLFVWLVPFRIVMVWVYHQTSSALIATIMHASLTASAIILAPTALSGWHLIAYDLTTGLMFATMAVVITRRAARWGTC